MLDVSSRLADDKKHDIRIEAALAKLYASELGWQVTDELMQVRGGRGYETAESLKARGEKPVPVEQLMRDMRINRIFEGSTEIMHLLIAREAVDQHLEVAGELLEGDGDLKAKARSAVEAGRFYSRWLPQLAVGKGQRPGSYEEFGALAGHVRYAERSSRKLARATFYAMSRWQAKLEKKQAVLGRIVDIGAELYAIACAAVYAQTLRAEHPERGDEAVALADLFIRQARRRVDALFGELFSNDDDTNYALAQQVLEGRHTWLEEGIADPSGDGPMIAPQPEEVLDRAGMCPGTPEHASKEAGRQGGHRVGQHRRSRRALHAQGRRSAAAGGAGLAGGRRLARVPGAGARRGARSWCRPRSSSSSAPSATCCWRPSPTT